MFERLGERDDVSGVLDNVGDNCVDVALRLSSAIFIAAEVDRPANALQSGQCGPREKRPGQATMGEPMTTTSITLVLAFLMMLVDQT